MSTSFEQWASDKGYPIAQLAESGDPRYYELLQQYQNISKGLPADPYGSLGYERGVELQGNRGIRQGGDGQEFFDITPGTEGRYSKFLERVNPATGQMEPYYRLGTDPQSYIIGANKYAPRLTSDWTKDNIGAINDPELGFEAPWSKVGQAQQAADDAMKVEGDSGFGGGMGPWLLGLGAFAGPMAAAGAFSSTGALAGAEGAGALSGAGGAGELIGGAAGDTLGGAAAGDTALSSTQDIFSRLYPSLTTGESAAFPAGAAGAFDAAGMGTGVDAGTMASTAGLGAGVTGPVFPSIGAASSAGANILNFGSAAARILAGNGTTADYLTAAGVLAGPLASLGAGALGASASGKAAQAGVDASSAAIAEQRRQYDTTRADNAPFLATGTAATARLKALLGLDPAYTGADAGSLTRKFTAADMNADPVYGSGLQFGLDEGAKAINARAIASGGYDSGATLKALTKFGNDYGSTKGNEAYQRYTADQGNIYNRLAGVSGAGQTAVNTVANAGQASTNAIGNSLTDAGNARAAGIVGGANAWGSAAQGINSAVNNYQGNQILQQLLAQRQPSSTFTG